MIFPLIYNISDIVHSQTDTQKNVGMGNSMSWNLKNGVGQHIVLQMAA